MSTELIPTSYLTTTVLTCVVGYLVVKLLRRKRYKLPPGPKGLPILGSYLTLTSGKYDQRELLNKWAKEYGDIYMFSLFGSRFVILNSYELVKEAFQSADFNDRAPILPCNRALNRPNTGLGLISASEGHQWKEQRNFVSANLRNVRQSNNNFEDLVSAQGEKLIKKFTNQGDSFFDPVTDIYVTVSNVTTKIIFGKTYNYDDEEFIDMTRKVKGVFDWMGPGSFFYHVPFLAYLPMKINKLGDTAVKGMFDFLEKEVRRHRLSYHPRDEPKDLIESFFQEQAKKKAKADGVGSFTDECLKQLLWDLLLGGVETVSNSLSWYFLFMAQYPDAQAKVQAELDEVVGRDRLPSLSDRKSLPITESTSVECYRFCRLLNVQIPHRTCCDKKLGGYDIPKGTNVGTNSGWLSSSPSLWKRCDEFVPDRFIDKDTGLFDSKLEAGLAEFGFGRRLCPGEQLARTQLFVIFTYILHRFTLRLPEGTPISRDGIDSLTHHPKPYKIKAIPRP
nr:cytochrome P450 2F2-like [Lytechinus pictus]